MGSGFPPHFLPPGTPLHGDGPRPPAGSILVRSQYGGFAAPPRKYTLYFGRSTDDVNVTVGMDDANVSRLHGVFTGDGHAWWLRCVGKVPIHRPDGRSLLQGHEIPMRIGYTPLTIETVSAGRRRSHLLEVNITESESRASAQHVDPESPTGDPDVYDLRPKERLAATILAQRYLRQEPNPQPVAWGQAATDLNRVDPGRQWTDRIVEHVIKDLRVRLANGPNPIDGLLREQVGEPVGNKLNVNLINALLESATLIPQDLEALGDDL